MCIAIYVKEGAFVPFEYLVEGARSNPDGCGLGWIEDGKLHTYKCMEFSDWCTKYWEIISRLDKPQMLIHFRITSKGDTNVDMCHPFWINDNKILIHNGTMQAIPKEFMEGGRSDTAAFAENILANLPEDWEYNPIILHILEDYIGYSKVVILDITGEVTFLNEETGHWLDDVWYSNKTYLSYSKGYTVYQGGKSKNLPARTDQYSNYYKDFNTVGNYNSNYDSCDNCKKTYSYMELAYIRGACVCPTCAELDEFDSEEADEIAITKLCEAENLLNKADETKEHDFIDELNTCDMCDGYFSSIELYGVFVESLFTEYHGTKNLCRECFQEVYINPEVISVEILY